jgi:hypothetical protein
MFIPGQWVACPACRSQLSVTILPALANPPNLVTTSSGTRAVEGEAVCFFHPEKTAAVACERCGRFLCALCDVPFGGKHLCPSCLDSSKMPELVAHRFIWGHMAMLMGIVPLVLFCSIWFWVVTGPAAIFVALWGWKRSPSLVHGPRTGLATIGIIGGLLQITGFTVLIWSLVKS